MCGEGVRRVAGAQTQKQWGRAVGGLELGPIPEKWELKGRVGPERWGPEGWRSQHAALFVPCLSLSLILGLLVELWPQVETVPHPHCAFGFLRGLFCASSGGPQATQWSPCGQGSGDPLLPKKKQNLVWCPQRGVAAPAQTLESLQKSTILILHRNSRAPSSLGGNC